MEKLKADSGDSSHVINLREKIKSRTFTQVPMQKYAYRLMYLCRRKILSFHCNTTFLLLKKTRVIFHRPMDLIQKNILRKYMMKNAMEFSCLDMPNSDFSSVQDRDI